MQGADLDFSETMNPSRLFSQEEVLSDDAFTTPALKKFLGLMKEISANHYYTDIELLANDYVRAGILKSMKIMDSRMKFTESELNEALFCITPAKYKSDGKIKYFPLSYSFSIKNSGHFRTMLMKTRMGTLLTLRRLSYIIPDWDVLGIPEFIKTIFLKSSGVVDEKTGAVISGGMKGGLILVTGPMGSGKTTTVASMLKLISDSVPSKMLTIEDPIEYVHFNAMGMVTQLEVGTHVDTQEEALYHSLRSNASLIFVGETRSPKELQMLLRAAEVGCLTVTSYHVPDAVSAMERMAYELNSEVARKVLASVLIGVLNQRLFFSETNGKPQFNLICEWLPVCSVKPVREFLIEQKFQEIRHGMEKKLWSNAGAMSFDMSIKQLVDAGKIDSRDLVNKFRYSTGPQYEIYG